MGNQCKCCPGLEADLRCVLCDIVTRVKCDGRCDQWTEHTERWEVWAAHWISLSLYAQPAICLEIFSIEGPDNVFWTLKSRLY